MTKIRFCIYFYLYILSLYTAVTRCMKRVSIKMSQESQKIISIIRHGRTEMNEVLSKHRWGDPNFNDAELWDTRLTDIGQSQARQLNALIRDPNSKYAHLLEAELIVSSPLSRAIHTSQLAFSQTRLFHEETISSLPTSSSSSSSSSTSLHSSSKRSKITKPPPLRLVHPLASERVYLSSDTGRPHGELKEEFPHWDYSLLPTDDKWWFQHPTFEPQRIKKGESVDSYVEWRPEGYYAVAGEPTEVFRDRMRALRAWLLSRPERHIVVVCHWGVARALSGLELANCEVKTLTAEEILLHPFIDDE